MRFLFVLIILLLLGATFVISVNGIHINKQGERQTFVGLYVSWLENLFSNTKTVVGNVIKIDWFSSGNSTRQG